MTKLIAVLIAVLAVGLAAASASANVHGCYFPYGHGPKNDRRVPLGHVSVRNMSCSAALRAISNGTFVGRGNLRTKGFSCRVLKSYYGGGVQTGADVRCTHASKAFRFSWAT